MKETPIQYRKRILANLQGKEPLAIQSKTPGRLATLVRGLSAAKCRRRPAPGKWCIAEILAHLADVEIAFGWRLRMILSHNGTPIQAFDQDRWARAGNYLEQGVGESLADFRALRQKNLRLLRSLPKPKWNNYGLHSERGRETLRVLAAMMAGHDLNHLRQIETLRRR